MENLENLLHALKTGEDLPNEVLFDESLLTWFESLWRLSMMPSGGEPVREHGAALVVAADGSLTVAVARPGRRREFSLDQGEMALEGFVGYYHTHPDENGITGDAFSDADFIATIYNDPMKILIAQSGDDLFMLVKTPKTQKPRNPHEISTQFYDWLDDYQDQGEVWQDALLLTNLDLCSEYGLAFYVGRMHQPLQRWL